MSNKKNTSTGIGFGGFIFLVFLTLKLGEIGPVQYWSWWWVTSPLWIPLLLILIIMLVIGFLITITTIKNGKYEGEQLEGPFLKDGSLGPYSPLFLVPSTIGQVVRFSSPPYLLTPQKGAQYQNRNIRKKISGKISQFWKGFKTFF